MKDPLVAPTLRGYQRRWLAPDVLAGLTLVAIAVPEQMATARLANMPAVAGLYAFVAGSLLFALIGRNRQMSVGADSTIAPVLAAGVVMVAAVGSPQFSHLISLLAIMVGAVVIAVGVLRLGWISEFLSIPVVTGVLAGIAVEIFVRQLPTILGLRGGGTSTLGRMQHVVDQLGHTNGWSLAIAAVVLAVIVVSERVDHRIPGTLIGLVGSIVAVAALKLGSHGVATIGAVHGGLPTFAVPSASWADARRLVGPALTVAFLIVAQTAATERTAAAAGAGGRKPAAGPEGPQAAAGDRGRMRAAGPEGQGAARCTPQEFNRDLAAIGAGNVLAGLLGSFSVNSSPPRTVVVARSGGRSQLTGVVAAVVALGVVLLATGLLKDLPQATLGAILIFVATRLLGIGELRTILRFDRLEFALALVALALVAVVGIEQGVVAAMLLGLAEQTRQSARPRDTILGREPGTDHWIPPDVGRPTEQVPGVIVYLVYGPLWYANADYFTERVQELVDSATPPIHGFVIDADGISDIDYTGTRTLGELATSLKKSGVTVVIARSSHIVHHDLKRSGLLHDIGPDQLFATVEEAVEALAKQA